MAILLAGIGVVVPACITGGALRAGYLAGRQAPGSAVSQGVERGGAAGVLDSNGQFQRFSAADPMALAARVAEEFGALAQDAAGMPPLRRLELLSRTGSGLTVLRREGEAEPVLVEALALARALGDQDRECQVLNNLATNEQYLGRREVALGLFAEALARAEGCSAWAQRDFILHHRGRCLVEMGRIGEARACFDAALVVRIGKGEQFYVDSTRRALAALDGIDRA